VALDPSFGAPQVNQPPPGGGDFQWRPRIKKEKKVAPEPQTAEPGAAVSSWIVPQAAIVLGPVRAMPGALARRWIVPSVKARAGPDPIEAILLLLSDWP